jgi:hypothetical protein
MMSLDIGRLGWLAGFVLLTATLLLMTRTELPTWIVRELAVSGRLAALVTCVLPATADDPSSNSARMLDMAAPDCETTAPGHVRAAWMTAC